jgi:aspartyl-tRNA(Asn)/glutamyl-tRNA(Gln) amidotransferase subunit A
VADTVGTALAVTITDTAAALRAGEVTSRQLVERGIALADAHDESLGVYLARFDEQALAAADRADADRAAGIDKGPLHGIPLGVKDIIATTEGPTTAQSLILSTGEGAGTWGAGIDAPVIQRLRAAGAIITGKTTTMEFATGRPDPAMTFPLPRNPWDPERWTGGSSSGTGNGVASGMFLGGLGTDTGGSVRGPAAFCGITGLKQTYGLVPKSGCVPLGLTYDHIGPMARSAADCAAMLAVMAGPDPSDPSTVEGPIDLAATLDGDLTGVRIGVDLSMFERDVADPSVESAIRTALTVLEEAGAALVELVIPMYQELEDVVRVGSPSESYSWHRKHLRARWADYGYPTRAAIINGAFVSGGDYVQAQRVRRTAREAVAATYADLGLDLIATPTAVAPAPPVEGIGDNAPAMRTMCTSAWNALGFPSLAVPAGFADDGLPASLLLNALPFRDGLTLKAGDAYQRRTDWHLRVPPLG